MSARAQRQGESAIADFSFGIEEEFFVVRIGSGAMVPSTPEELRQRWTARFDTLVTSELLQAQIELRTPVCATLRSARETLSTLRRGMAEEATAFGLALLGAGTHPLGDWRPLLPGESPRHAQLFTDFGIVARRNAVCGMHVHVATPADCDRIGLMNRIVPWTPLLLALSASSPFWCGDETGFASYRQCAYDEWPRTGTPPRLADDAAFAAWVARLQGCGSLEDARSIWWTIRPSPRYPTLELRITDTCSELDDALAIAALFRCLVRAAATDESFVDDYDRDIVEENRWRAKRDGVRAVLLDPCDDAPRSLPDLLEGLLRKLRPHADAFDCAAELSHLHAIVAGGSGATRQLACHAVARAAGADRREALRAVVDEIVRATEGAAAGGGPTPAVPTPAA